MIAEDAEYVIYGLDDPRDGDICYVGLTSDLPKRIEAHARMSGSNIRLVDWVRELRLSGLMFEVEEFERVSGLAKARERERYWIEYWLAEEEPLKNVQGTALERLRRIRRSFSIERRKSGKHASAKSRAVFTAVEEYGIDEMLFDTPGYATLLRMDERTLIRWLREISDL